MGIPLPTTHTSIPTATATVLLTLEVSPLALPEAGAGMAVCGTVVGAGMAVGGTVGVGTVRARVAAGGAAGSGNRLAGLGG
jgi:hypothetical protein